MNQYMLVGMSLALILFVWVWIGITIMARLSLEKKIEKLNNITNPLPEEERLLNHLKEMRAIEQNKVGSAKFVLGFFGLLLLGALVAVPMYKPVFAIFGSENLIAFTYVAVVLLAFFVVPTYVGLSLAGTKRKDPVNKKEEDAPAPAPAKEAVKGAA